MMLFNLFYSIVLSLATLSTEGTLKFCDKTAAMLACDGALAALLACDGALFIVQVCTCIRH